MSGKRSLSRRIKQTTLILSLLLLFVLPLSGEEITKEDRNLPVWVLMEKGKAAYRDQDFGTALTFFTYARDKGAVLPEAEYWMGRIYEEEGELPLAILQYEKALEQDRYLYIHDDRIEIVYRLADAYKMASEWDKYEFQLQSLVNQEMTRNRESLDREHLYVTTLKEKGIDELLYLYRLDYSYSLRAFRELGVYNYKKERYRSATIYSLYSVMTFFSLGIEELIREEPNFQFPRNLEKLLELDPQWYYDNVEKKVRAIDPDFSFIRKADSRDLVNREAQIQEALLFLSENGEEYHHSSVGYILDLFKENRALLSFSDENNIYQSLYYLACGLYGEGFDEAAKDLWIILKDDERAHSWGLLASQQLISPHLDKSSSLF